MSHPTSAPPTPSEIRWVEHAPRTQELVDGEPFQSWTLPDGTAWTYFFRQGQDYLLRFPELADFTVSIDGLTVESWPAPGTSPGTVLQLYLNQVVPLARSRQGTLVPRTCVTPGARCDWPTARVPRRRSGAVRRVFGA